MVEVEVEFVLRPGITERQERQSDHHPACQRSASTRYGGACLYSQNLVGETGGSEGQVRSFWVIGDPVLKKTRQDALLHTPEYTLLYNWGIQRRQHLLLMVIFNLTVSIHFQKVIFLWRIIGNDYFITKNNMFTLGPFPELHNSFHKICNIVILIT